MQRPRLAWHRTTVDGRQALYAEVGAGPPVVFLHGWGLSARAYGPALARLAGAGARVIAPALPGFGRSDPVRGRLSWDRLADWMDRLLDAAGVGEPAFFVGHSFGGGVATVTAWHHPQRVRSLVLVNSVGGAVWREGLDGPEHLRDRPWWDWGLHLPTEFAGRAYRTSLPVIARDFLGNVISSPRSLVRAGALARRADLRDELATVSERGLPVTVLWGSRDRLLPEAAFLAMVEAGGEADVVAGGGHSWLIADPEAFGEALTNSLTIHAMLTRDRAAS